MTHTPSGEDDGAWLNLSRKSGWNPRDVPFWQRPIGRVIKAGPLLGVATWFASQFLQVRGYVNLTASRVDLAIMAAMLSWAVWVAASILPRRFQVWLICTAGIVLISVMADRVFRSPHIAENFLQLDRVAFVKGNATLCDQCDLFINAYYAQHGSMPLDQARATSFVLFAENPGDDSDERAKASAAVVIEAFRKAYFADPSRGDNVGVGKGLFGTAKFHITSQTAANEVVTGKLRMYVLGWAIWREPDGNTDEQYFCQWLQAPESHDLSDYKSLIWHGCVGGGKL